MKTHLTSVIQGVLCALSRLSHKRYLQHYAKSHKEEEKNSYNFERV